MAINGAPIDCINAAVIAYHVKPTLILSVIQKEGGKNGQAVKNKDRTFDYGIMQINQRWLPKIAAYGYTKEDIQYDPCKNILVGTWIIAMHLSKNIPPWVAIGNYHSKTPSLNKKYRDGVYETYKKISMVIHDI